MQSPVSVANRKAQAAALIARATTKRELRHAYFQYVGRDKSFCVLGPEFTGCFNSGERARIRRFEIGPVEFAVGTELRPFLMTFDRGAPRSREQAWSAFIEQAMVAVRFNVKTKAEIAKAIREPDPVARAFKLHELGVG